MTHTEAPARTDSFRPVLGAAVFLFMALLAIAGLKSWRDLETARERERLLEKRIEATNSEIERLRGKIERLRDDPGALERLAREDLGMVRPGDVVIELPRPAKASSPGPAKAAAAVSPPASAPSP